MNTHLLAHTQKHTRQRPAVTGSVTTAEFSNWLRTAASAKSFGPVGKLSAVGICYDHFPLQDSPMWNTWVRTLSSNLPPLLSLVTMVPTTTATTNNTAVSAEARKWFVFPSWKYETACWTELGMGSWRGSQWRLEQWVRKDQTAISK